MIPRYKAFLLIGLLCFVLQSMAQDVHLSQFSASPLFLNSALGGQHNGDWRAGLSFRQQWKSVEKPFNSSVAFFDRKIPVYSKQINGGLLFVHDESGNAKIRAEKIYLNVAYPITRGRSTISIGVQPGMVMKSYKDDLTYPTQFDPNTGYFNSGLSNNESAAYGNTQMTYFDLNMGLFWHFHMPKFRPSFGIALLHLNQADESFNKTGSKLDIRQNIHANARIILKKGLYLKPALSYSAQNEANQILAGGDIGKLIKGKTPIKEIFAGIYMRNGFQRNFDAFYPLVGMQYDNWRFGMSYDINVSDLDQATGYKGAFELSIIYTAPNTSPTHSAIPCERY